MALILLTFLLAVAVASAQLVQGPPPDPVLLTAEKSGVLPVLPTPFNGVETLEGAIIYAGEPNPGFTGVYGNASAQQNNAGVTYTAFLPASNFDPLTGSNITGYINATVPSNGTGVMFTVDLQGFPSEKKYGPFVYHIHGTPVPSDGNCTSTLGHLDTTNRGELYPCDSTQPMTCQVGDLSGKHGNITGTHHRATYLDPYLSTNPENSYYFGMGSIVIHSSNTTRLTCANFTLFSAGTSNYTNASISSVIASMQSSSSAALLSMSSTTSISSMTITTTTTETVSESVTVTAASTTASSTGGATHIVVGGIAGAAVMIAGAILV